MDVQTRMVRDLEAPARPGVTLIELVIVMLIAGVLIALAYPPMRSYIASRDRLQERDALVMIAARARAAAVEKGEFVLMTVSPTDNSVVVKHNGDVIDALRPRSTIAREAGTSDITICYSPRGFAHPSCRDGGTLPDRVGFTSGDKTAWALITLGRVEAL